MTDAAASKASLDQRMHPHRQQLDEQGYTIVENAIDDGFADEILAVVERIESETDNAMGQDRFRGMATIKIQNLLARDKVFRELALNIYSRHLVEHLLGPGFLLTTTQTMDLMPGELRQPVHADDMYYGSRIGRPHLPIVGNTVWAITDFTAENGATVVLPGSHRWPNLPAASLPEAIERADEPIEGLVPVVMPKGSVLVLNGSVWHAGGANQSGQRRLGIAVNHCAGWLRPEHNNLLAMPLDQVRTFDPALQDMLGFGVYEGIIGRLNSLPPLEALAAQGR